MRGSALSSCIRSLQAATSLALHRHGVKGSNLRRYGGKLLVLASGSVAAGVMFTTSASLASPEFMADTITREEKLRTNSSDMKVKMELMIMKIQVSVLFKQLM
jgi:hypothetical protein